MFNHGSRVVIHVQSQQHLPTPNTHCPPPLSPSGFGKVDTSDWAVSEDQVEWRKQKEEERAKQEDEVEARMQKWLADAAAKKAAGGQ